MQWIDWEPKYPMIPLHKGVPVAQENCLGAMLKQREKFLSALSWDGPQGHHGSEHGSLQPEASPPLTRFPSTLPSPPEDPSYSWAFRAEVTRGVGIKWYCQGLVLLSQRQAPRQTYRSLYLICLTQQWSTGNLHNVYYLDKESMIRGKALQRTHLTSCLLWIWMPKPRKPFWGQGQSEAHRHWIMNWITWQ